MKKLLKPHSALRISAAVLASAIIGGSVSAAGLVITHDTNVVAGRNAFLASGIRTTEFDWVSLFAAGTTWVPGNLPPFIPSMQSAEVTLPDLTVNAIKAIAPSSLSFGNWLDGPGFDGPGGIPAPDLAINDIESFDLTFGRDHSTVGFAVAIGKGNLPNEIDLTGATFRFTVRDADGAILDSGDFLLPAGVANEAWLTLTSDSPFRRIDVREIDAPTIADQYFSNILTSTETLPQWNVNASGNWGIAGNWLPVVVPDGPGAAANFLGVITAPRIVTLNGNRTAGRVVFNNSNSYMIAGPGSLRLDNGVADAVVEVVQGDHVISVPVVLVSDTMVTIGVGASLSVGSLRGAGLSLTAGTLRILPDGTDAGVSVLEHLAIAPGAVLDLADNDLVVQATGPLSPQDVLATITDQIGSGRNGGATVWTGPGVTSLAAANDPTKLTSLGVILNDDGTGVGLYSVFSGQVVDTNSILVKYTWHGDSDLTGIVDADDYFRIDSGFASNGALAGWVNGDFDYSGGIDADDYFLIDSSFAGQTGVLGSGAVAVPEPSLGLLIGAAALMMRRRRRM